MMIFSAMEADEYFSLHLKYELWNALPQNRKQAALCMAEQDVATYLGELEADPADPMQYSAVFEQAVFLIEHYDRLSGGQTIVSEKIDGVGSRSYRHIDSQPLHIAPRALLFLDRVKFPSRIGRG